MKPPLSASAISQTIWAVVIIAVILVAGGIAISLTGIGSHGSSSSSSSSTAPTTSSFGSSGTTSSFTSLVSTVPSQSSATLTTSSTSSVATTTTASVSSFYSTSLTTRPSLSANISLNSPVAGYYDVYNGEIYVASANSHDVFVINGSTDSIVQKISVGGPPSFLLYEPQSKELFVLNYNPYSISIINTSSNTVASTIKNAGGPAVLDPYTNTVYATQYSCSSQSPTSCTSNLLAIDGSKDTVQKVISLPRYPAGPPSALAYDPSNKYLYAAIPNNAQPAYLAAPGNVTVINTVTNTRILNITVGYSPDAMVYDPHSGNIYVSNLKGLGISVIDGSTNTLLTSVEVNYSPTLLALDPQSGDIYVMSSGTGPQTGGTNSTAVISDASNSVVANVFVGYSPCAAAYDNGSGVMFVSNLVDSFVPSHVSWRGNSTSEISTTTHQVISTIHASIGSEWSTEQILFNQEGTKMYLLNPVSNMIYVVSLQS